MVLQWSPLMGQLPAFQSTGYTTENSSISHNTVLNVFQDSRGFLWIGTMDGLNRFDGQHFEIYRHNPADSTTISDSFIHGIFERSDGKLWIGTRDGGFNILDPKTNNIRRIEYRNDNKFNVPNRPSNLMFEDSEGFFWIGFFASSMGTFDDATQRYIPIALELEVTERPISSVNSVLEFSDGSFLISSLEGLFHIRQEEIARFRENPAKAGPITVERVLFSKKNPFPETNALYIDNEGALWGEMVGIGFEKVELLGFPEHVQLSVKSGVLSTSSDNVVIERESYLLFGAGGGAIEYIDKVTNNRQRIRVSEKEITGSSRIFLDNDGNIWFATWGGGLFILEEKKGIELYNSTNGLPFDFMLAFADDTNGTWIGSNGGLAFLGEDGRITPYNGNESGLDNVNIWSLWRDDLGLWISTRFSGLYFISNNSIESGTLTARNFNPDNSLILYEDVHQVLRDSRGWLWLGYQGNGVQIIKNVEEWLNGAPANVQLLSDETPEPAINSRSIRKFYEDNDGNIWIATTDNGFNYVKFNDQAVSEITTFEYHSDSNEGLSHPDGRNILQQNDSTFWFASYGGGITRWRSSSNSLLNLRTNDGLANNSTYGVLADKNERFIWISTNNGISRLDTESLRFTNFTTADGLQNNEFNTGAYLKKQDGRLVFGGVGGFNIIDTEELALDEKTPPVFISEINVFNEPLKTDTAAIFRQQLTLPYDQNFLSFEFSALDLSQPQFVQFAYKLTGVDEEWVYSGNRNFADYPNLEPGEYLLQVKAANSDGFWNEEGVSLSLTINPPWWQTIWFRIMAALSIITAFGLIIRHYSQRKLKVQIRKMEIEQKLRGERERISRDLHDHVGAQLANIMSGLSLVDKYNEFGEKEKSSDLMNSLRGDAEVTINQLRETIWALNQNALTLEEFSDHLKSYLKNQSALTSALRVHVEVQEDTEVTLSSTQALNLFRIIQEASQNTLKYAKAQNLQIRIEQVHKAVLILVRDDGTFRKKGSDFNGGYGMTNMQKRAHEINAQFSVDTSNGTEIKVRLPI